MCLGIPGKVTELYQANGMKMGKVDFGGVVKEACLEYLPDIEVGDYTIVHVGFGISQLDEEEARETLKLLREMDMIAGELGE
jgi:hydrogenase expression/formation protein HypC